MGGLKRKAIVDPLPYVNEGQKPKAIWDLRKTGYFIQACLTQVARSERTSTTFTKKGWKGILSELNEKTGKNYSRSQLKNKWDSLRKDWSTWNKLFGGETGLGWDEVNHTVVMEDEWWENKQLANPLYGKFRYKGLPYRDQLNTFFKDVVANGEYAWAPSCGTMPNVSQDDDDDNDGYRPCLKSAGIDTQEGSGDSEDGSVGATTNFANINLNTSQGSVSQRSGGKKKKIAHGKNMHKNKVPASSKIAEAVSVIAETCKSRNVAVASASIGEVMAEIQNLDEIANDPDWHTKCCQLMMFKPAREMFVALRGLEEKRLHWLRHAAYNPLSFMNM